MNPLSPVTGAGALVQAMATSSSGMQAQATRMRIAAENMANVNSTAATPGGDAYRRKLVIFEQMVDRATGASMVRPATVINDPRPFNLTYDPSHPAADERGYVKKPNVTEAIEAADMREAGRSYEAALSAMNMARSMYTKTIDILRS